MTITQRAGEYRTRGIVQRLKTTATINAAGQIDESLDSNWETYCQRWLRMETRAARESLTGDQLTASRTIWVSTRYDSTANAINETMRLKIGSRTFGIAGPPQDVDMQRKEVEFPVIEAVRS